MFRINQYGEPGPPRPQAYTNLFNLKIFQYGVSLSLSARLASATLLM